MKDRPYHHGDLRSTLLALAEETLRDRGPAELSLRELARDAGVSPAAPSRHFRSKQALLDALALAGFERLTGTLAGTLAAAGDTFAQRLDALTRTYVAFAVDNAALLELMFARKHDPTAPPELVEAPKRLLASATSLIEDGQRRGEIRTGPVDVLAVPLLAALQGLTTLALNGGFPAEQLERSLTETIDFTLRGYAP
jgi:AcrR family transcriptional regulator